jgi:hypothetical protein
VFFDVLVDEKGENPWRNDLMTKLLPAWSRLKRLKCPMEQKKPVPKSQIKIMLIYFIH